MIEASDGWVETDEFLDTHSSLVMLSEAVEQANLEPGFWKFAILACHSALQGACVCFLTGTDGGGALTSKSEKELNHYHNLVSQRAICENSGTAWILGEPEYPQISVAPLPDLLKRLPRDTRVNIPKQFDLITDDKTLYIKHLHDLRNELTHFPSQNWSIEKELFIHAIKHGFELTAHIVRRGDFRRRNRFADLATEKLLRKLNAQLKDLQTTV